MWLDKGDKWLDLTFNLSEDIMRRWMYPDNEQPTTLPPLFIVLGDDNFGLIQT